MAKKPFGYAWLEGVAQEMRANKSVCYIGQLNIPTSTLPTGEVIDLAKEFGTVRTVRAPIDEDLNVNMSIGAAMAGLKMVAAIPSMVPHWGLEFIHNQAGSLRLMTGGQANTSFVLIVQGASRVGGPAAQHVIVGAEAAYATLPGIKVVVPSDAYNGKGLMVAAIRDADPVMFVSYSEVGSTAPVEVPDEAYTVEIGKAKVRQEGKDLTLVAWAPATIDVNKALPEIAKAGVNVEFIDLQSIKPLDTATLFASVKKTGRMLVVEHGPYVGFSSHVISEVAQFVPGAKLRKITFPDAPGPGAKEMIEWMRPDAPKILDAAVKMMTI
ncbi:MAG: transketolase [Chloroflexi bacterium]|nr:transketolase [Chloroflexota bacterium]